MANAVEAVALNTSGGQFIGNRVGARHCWQLGMERGIKHGHLGRLGANFRHQFDSQQVRWVVEWSIFTEFPNGCFHLRIHAHRCLVTATPMNHAMTNDRNLCKAF